jgi:probable rRNA maturation factor
MMVNVSIPEQFAAAISEDRMTLAALKALENQKVNPDQVDVGIVLENNAQLRELNQQYLGIDAATDVLSFALDEKDPETGRLYLGDVIISVEKAQEQADKAGHAVSDELQLLAVHGILHLLGHDHAGEEEKNKMWAAQRQILADLNLDLKKWPED